MVFMVLSKRKYFQAISKRDQQLEMGYHTTQLQERNDNVVTEIPKQQKTPKVEKQPKKKKPIQKAPSKRKQQLQQQSLPSPTQRLTQHIESHNVYDDTNYYIEEQTNDEDDQYFPNYKEEPDKFQADNNVSYILYDEDDDSMIQAPSVQQKKITKTRNKQ